MTTKDFTANVISATKVVPDGNFKDSKASGIWDINEVLDLIKGGNWPNVANINPAAFVDALFQIHLWTGNGTSDRTITNNIDLSGKGGLVWTKERNDTDKHLLIDTERGATKYLQSATDSGEATSSESLKVFNSDGFTIGNLADINGNNDTFVSWTFRKQPKFFDIVTYTGDGQDGGRTIAHNLGSVPGMILVKRTNSDFKWVVYHRGNTAAPETDVLHLNLTDATADLGSAWYDVAPTSSVFTVGDQLGVNQNNSTYVAYLFAHNNDDGGFGEPGDQDIIKCGSYTGNTSTRPTINLGFEPQFLMIKRTDSADNWYMLDTMRGILTSGGNDTYLYANANTAEATVSEVLKVTATGFQLEDDFGGWNASGGNYIYMAIRRGGMQTPTAASDVFAVNIRSSSDGEGKYTSGFPVDFSLANNYDAEGNTFAGTRLTNTHLQTNATVVEASSATDYEWDHNDGVSIGVDGFFGGSTNNINWMWKRARGYFDVVAYTGNGQNGQQIKHNLGVAPELTFIKNRGTTANWLTLFYAGELANNEGWQSTQAFEDASSYMSSSFPNQATYFGASANSNAGASSNNYIAYLFATAAGVSKVGSFTQSGATNVACGFTGDTPALIILKRTDDTGNWYLFDSARGIVAGNDKSLYLNTTAAEVTNADVVDPYSGGFATTSSLANGDYIFYAIASIA